MLKTLVILASMQGNLNLVDRYALYDQVVAEACITVETELFILAYPYNLPMTYIKR